MSSTLPSFPPGQMAKLDNMLSKITLKSHGRVSVCLPACLSVPHGIPAIFAGVWRLGRGGVALFGTVTRKPEPASLLLIDIRAL